MYDIEFADLMLTKVQCTETWVSPRPRIKAKGLSTVSRPLTIDTSLTSMIISERYKIGRASCRERVCQYV